MESLLKIIISVFFALGFLAFFHNLFFVQLPRNRWKLLKTFRPKKAAEIEAAREHEKKNGNQPFALNIDGREVIVWAKNAAIATKKYNTHVTKTRQKYPREIFTKRKTDKK